MGTLNAELELEMPLWRIWLETGTDIELIRKWTYPDVLKALAVLDMRDEYRMAMDRLQYEDTEKARKI